jgi:hypothetical protein
MNKRTAKELISDHVITIQLKRLGVTDEQLNTVRFRPHNDGLPFDRWTFTWGLRTPLEILPWMKDFCALKWLLLGEPPPSRDRDDAYHLVSVAMAAPTFHRGVNFSRTQRLRAKKPRGKVNDDNVRIEQIIERLALNPEHRDETAKELWPHFFHELEEAKFRPVDDPRLDPRKMSYRYKGSDGSEGGITFRRFANIVSRFRKKSR